MGIYRSLSLFAMCRMDVDGLASDDDHEDSTDGGEREHKKNDSSALGMHALFHPWCSLGEVGMALMAQWICCRRRIRRARIDR